MKDLIILGTGVHAAEMAEIVDRVNAARPTWRLIGHIAPKPPATAGSFHGNPVLGTIEALDKYPDACLVPDNEFPRALLCQCGHGLSGPCNSESGRRARLHISLPRERFISLIDPSCFISRTATIGVGCVFYPGCFIGLNAQIGDFVFALSGCAINHDDVIGDRTVFASGATLAGVVHAESDCYLGQSCTVRQHLRIGKGSLLGMGCVVVKDVPPNSVMVGNPARRLRDRVSPAKMSDSAIGGKQCAQR